MSNFQGMLILLFLVTGLVLFLLGLAQVFFDTNLQTPAYGFFAGGAFFGLLTRFMLPRSETQ